MGGAIANFKKRRDAEKEQALSRKRRAETTAEVGINLVSTLSDLSKPAKEKSALQRLAALFDCDEGQAINKAQAFIDSGARVIGIGPALKGSEKTVFSEVSNGVIDVIAECDTDELTHAASLASDSATDIADASYEVSNSAADIADATADISAAADEIKEVVREVKKSPEVPLSSPSKREMKPEKSLNK